MPRQRAGHSLRESDRLPPPPPPLTPPLLLLRPLGEDEFGPFDEYSLGWKVAAPELLLALPAVEPAPAAPPEPAAPEPEPAGPTARVYGFSDLHVDYKENFQWCERLSPAAFKEDILLLAGDLTDDLVPARPPARPPARRGLRPSAPLNL